MSTNISKNPPVLPSARNQFREPAVTPEDAWPPSHDPLAPRKYIARSTSTGALAVTVVANDRSASSGSWFVQIVNRWLAAIV